MKTEQIEQFVMRYLESYNCQIIEKTREYVTVKLSPEADRELTGRPYYWSFVERTGVEPETMTYTWIFRRPDEAVSDKPGSAADIQAKFAPASPQIIRPAPHPPSSNAAKQPQGSAPGSYASDSILGRYFGFVPAAPIARVPTDEVTFGSRRLAQLFASAKNHGRYVRLFEEPGSRPVFGPPLLTYGTWFAMNFKVELVCDMKRSEIHSLGIHLTTGEIREQFYDYTLSKKLTPRLPENIHLTGEVITLSKATHSLEEYLQQKLMRYDHSWAKEANIRLQEELDRIHYYYNGLLLAAEMDKRSEISAQFAGRRQEIDWQYRPRIKVSVINCGLFHLRVFS